MVNQNEYNETLIFFNCSAMVKWIHELPRRDLHNKKVTNEFSPTERPYWEAIVIAAIPALALGLVTFLFFCLRGCVRCWIWCCVACKCCKASPALRQFKAKPKRVIWAFIITWLLVIGGVIYGFVANHEITKGVDDVQAALSDMDDMRKDNLNSASLIADSLDTIGVSATEMKVQMQDLVSDIPFGNPVLDDLQSALDNLDEISNLMSDASDTIHSAMDSYQDVPIKDVINEIEKYDGYRSWAQIGVLSFLLLPYFVVFISILCNLQMLVWNVTWLSVLSALLGWILTAVETSASLVFSDICVDPSGLILDHVDSNPTLYDYVSYFVICQGKVNPLQDQLNSATDAATQSLDIIAQVKDYVDQVADVLHTLGSSSVDEKVSALDDSVTNITTASTNVVDEVVDIINTVFKCNRLHNNYILTLRGICGKALNGLVGLVIVQGAMAFLTWIAIFCGIQLYRFLSRRKYKSKSAVFDLTGIMFGKYDPHAEAEAEGNDAPHDDAHDDGRPTEPEKHKDDVDL
eukprot:c9491_g1_i1.p1 GENE.c9491_g1_i1~~c9491_g1_i1.p1  ORF type:complete len:519 (-),score=119.37 c9491_g1_i1:58-1614(-)